MLLQEPVLERGILFRNISEYCELQCLLIFSTFVCVCVCVCVWRGGMGVGERVGLKLPHWHGIL